MTIVKISKNDCDVFERINRGYSLLPEYLFANDQKIFIREKRKFLTIVVKTGGTTTVFSAIDRAIVNKEDNSLTLINYYGSRRVVAEHIHLEMYDWVTFYDTDCLSIPRMGFKVPSKRN